MKRLIIGLTGGIGSGKTAAADGFARRHASIVDTDLVAHSLTATGGKAMPAIATVFGPTLITPEGSLDRTAMRKLVFADPTARQRLEGILHPLIRSECAELCRNATGPYTVLVVPLLIESDYFRQQVHRIAVVDCPEALQVERVMQRSHLTRTEVEQIMASQTTRRERLAAADDVIDNSKDLAHLDMQIEGLHQKYAEIAQND